MRENTGLFQAKGLKVLISNKTIIEFVLVGYEELLRPQFVLPQP